MNTVCIKQPRIKIQSDETYQRLFDGQDEREIMMWCRRQALAPLQRYPDRKTAIDKFIKTRVEECKYLSTNHPERVQCRQLMMVVSLSIMAYDDPYDEMVKAVVLRAKRISSAAKVLHNIAYSISSGLSEKGIKQIDSAALRKVNRILNCNFISKNGRTSVITLTELAGYTRDQLIALFDGFITQKIADDAMRIFCPEITAA